MRNKKGMDAMATMMVAVVIAAVLIAVVVPIVRNWGKGAKDVGDNYLAKAQDSDNDGLANAFDNCPNHANTDQLDTDGDGKGDECDEEAGEAIA
tara:strand:+ start:317 stop:598 length:282 start_codon:yes stop_codon:yes gene_type:complete